MKDWPAFFSINAIDEIAAFDICFQNPQDFRKEHIFTPPLGLTFREEPNKKALQRKIE